MSCEAGTVSRHCCSIGGMLHGVSGMQAVPCCHADAERLLARHTVVLLEMPAMQCTSTLPPPSMAFLMKSTAAGISRSRSVLGTSDTLMVYCFTARRLLSRPTVSSPYAS